MLPANEDWPVANVVELPSGGRERSAPQPADEPGNARPAWGPSGDFLGSRPPVAAAADAATAVFEFAGDGPAAETPARGTDDSEQDFFFERWGQGHEDAPTIEVAASHGPDTSPNSEPPASGAVHGASSPRGAGDRFPRDVSAAREESVPVVRCRPCAPGPGE